MIDFTEVPDGETWELFGRDFLLESGYHLESSPDRGPDGGKDMLVVETLAGEFGSHPFRWLVSCKHNAKAGTAVGEAEERNILERMRQHRADGFMGFYSTLPSAALNTRLNQLRENKDIRDFLSLDHRVIEAKLLDKGYSALLMRYFPESYRRVRPLHVIEERYLPLPCASCGQDLLEELFQNDYHGMVCHARRLAEDDGELDRVEDVYWVHKGECDRKMEYHWNQQGCVVGWEDLSDLTIPWWFLRWTIITMNIHRDRVRNYADGAYDHEMYFIRSLSQKIYRATTERERERLQTLWGLTHFMA